MQAMTAVAPLAAALGPVGPAIAAAGTLIGAVGQMSTTAQQARALRASAELDQENASRAVFRAQVDAQDQDIEAGQQISSYVATQAQSGLRLSSDYFQMAERRLRVLAARDRYRLRQQGDIEAANYQQRASASLTEAKNLSSSMIFDALGSVATAGSQFIGNPAYYNGSQPAAAPQRNYITVS